jgi:CheY-like chemotaxis protein
VLAIILVVEDELWLSLDISEALEDEGYDVIAVANADEAIKVLESRRHPHHLHGYRPAGFNGRTDRDRADIRADSNSEYPS